MLLVAILVLALFDGALGEVPQASCSAKDVPKMNQCILSFVREVLPTVAVAGIPELKIDPVDPFHIQKVGMNLKSTMVQGKLTVSKATLKGVSKSEVKSLKIDLANLKKIKIQGKVFAKKLQFEGSYKSAVKLAGLDVHGKGTFKLFLEDVESDISAVASVNCKNGKAGKYLQVKKINVVPKLGNLKVKVTGLMPKNEEVAKAALDVLNKRWQELYKDMLPFMKPIIEENALKTAKKFASKFALSNFLQDIPCKA